MTKPAAAQGSSADWKVRGACSGMLSIYLRRLPDHRGKQRLFNLLCGALPGTWLLEQSSSGTKLAVDPQEFIGCSIIKNGSFEPASLSQALTIIERRGGWFTDICAQHGLASKKQHGSLAERRPVT